MPTKEDVARLLAVVHREFEPYIDRIVRLVTEHEGESGEPVKLLEVNPYTSPSGIVPIVLMAAPPRVPFPSIVVEVTGEEYDQICSGQLSLPAGWQMGDILYPLAA
jgi:hypothetical protein